MYGFSRGAAAARAFVNWLSGLLPKPGGEEKKPAQCLAAGSLKIPLSVEFLGLLDTVASVGVPHLAPVALHEIYAAAFAAGAPLKVTKDALPEDFKKDQWRIMPDDLRDQFNIAAALGGDFNAWRTLTLNFPPSTEIISDEQAVLYTPVRASVSLEKAIDEQIAWITAWRIGRYAGGSYKTQRFYVDSAANGLDRHSDPALRKADEGKRRAEQKVVNDERKKMRDGMKKGEFTLLPQGPKDFDVALGQTQLREAAEEFRQDYQGVAREGDGE